jgi:hypothetical protein
MRRMIRCARHDDRLTSKWSRRAGCVVGSCSCGARLIWHVRRPIRMSIRLRTTWVLLFVGVLVGVGCTDGLAPQVSIPPDHLRTRPEASDPTGEPPAVRYRNGYESFWWNCLALKAADSDARCPFVCSGTTAAADGCRQGAADAELVTQELFQRVGKENAQDRLRSRVAKVDAQQSIRRYFP